MVKVKLLTVPQTYNIGRSAPRIGLPLGVLYIASVLEKNNYSVSVFDSLLCAKSKKIDNKLIHFGTSWEEIEDLLKKDKPDIIGISNRWTEQVSNAIKLADIAKKVCPNSLVIVGGPHASIKPLDFLKKDSSIDIVIMGEGEYVMLDILKHYSGKKKLSSIKNIAYKSNNKFIINERAESIKNLDDLPLPAYHLVNMEKYFKAIRKGFETRPYQLPPSTKTISMITSRGCPFNCIFCSIHPHMGYKWRGHTPDYILKHIEHVIKKYNINHIHFEDDNLTLDKERFLKILDGIISKGLKFSWDTPNGVRADTLDEKLLIKMKQSGVERLKIAIESGNQKILDELIEKKLDLSRVMEIAKLCKKLKIPLSAFYIIGIAGETKKNIEETLGFALKLKKNFNVIPHVSIAHPLLGSRLYIISKEKGYLLKEPSLTDFESVFANGLIKTEEFSPNDLSMYINKFYKKIAYYQIKGCVNPINFLKVIRTIIRSPQTSLSFFRNGLKMLKYKQN